MDQETIIATVIVTERGGESRNTASTRSGTGARGGRNIGARVVRGVEIARKTDIVDADQNEFEMKVRVLEIVTESATAGVRHPAKERGGTRAQETHVRPCHTELVPLDRPSNVRRY